MKTPDTKEQLEKLQKSVKDFQNWIRLAPIEVRRDMASISAVTRNLERHASNKLKEINKK